MAITSYVHYYAKSILNDSGTASLSKDLDEIKSKIYNEQTYAADDINPDAIDALVARINQTKAMLADTGNESSINAAAIIKNYVEEQTKTTIQSIDIEKGIISAEKNGGVPRLTRDNSTYGIEINKIVNTMNRLLDSTLSRGQIKVKDLQALVNKTLLASSQLTSTADEIVNRLNAFVSDSKNGINSVAIKEAMRDIQKANGSNRSTHYFSRNNKAAENKIIRVINDCIAILNPILNYNLAKGALFEAIVAATQLTAQEVSKKAITELVTGQNKAITAFKGSNFNSNVMQEAVKQGTFSAAGNGYYVAANAHPTQGKVDVILNIPESSGKAINVSAKNVNLTNSHGWIHTVSNASLLALLQDADSQFMNHYTNLFAEHPDKNIDRALNGVRQQYLKVAQYLIAAQALTGNINRIDRDGNAVDDTANVLLVNDSSSGEIKGYSIAAIKRKILQKYQTQSEWNNTNTISTRMDTNGRFSNTWVEDDGTMNGRIRAKYQRSAAVLASMEATKIFASININLMNAKNF